MGNLLIAAFVVLCTVLPSLQRSQVRAAEPENSTKQQAKPTTHKKQAQLENTPTTTPTPLPRLEVSQAKPETAQRQYDPRSDPLYRLYLLANVIGVAGGLVGLVFLIVQAVASKQAAEAALKSAVAVMNAERAWIVADMENPPAYVPDHVMRFACRLRNMGKTPARIKEVAERAWVGTKTNPLPINPEYEANQIHPSPSDGGAVMAPNVTMPRLVYVFPADMKEIECANWILHIHGYVIYEDVFGQEHVTKYGFYLNIPMGGADQVTRMFYMSDLPGYNEAT